VSIDNPDTSVVVIGAGQAGLSVSYYLQRLGLDAGNDFVVLDRGPSTGGAWQQRWEALRIGSAHRINDLPGMEAIGLSFETADRSLPAKEVVRDYYEKYEEHYDFQIIRPANVTTVENRGATLVLSSVDDSRKLWATPQLDATGTATVRVPPGTYSALGVATTIESGEFTYTFVGDPQVEVGPGGADVTLDGRDAVPVGPVVDRPTEAVSAKVSGVWASSGPCFAASTWCTPCPSSWASVITSRCLPR